MRVSLAQTDCGVHRSITLTIRDRNPFRLAQLTVFEPATGGDPALAPVWEFATTVRDTLPQQAASAVTKALFDVSAERERHPREDRDGTEVERLLLWALSEPLGGPARNWQALALCLRAGLSLDEATEHVTAGRNMQVVTALAALA